MNKTKRKIFETSLELFAEKGYDSTSIEEITAKVGVAKGTLYYHFTSKEEIFNFLIQEGMNLLKNSITIKTKAQEKFIDKIRAVVLIQIKILVKYNNFMSVIYSELWRNTQRSKTCKKYIDEYLNIIKDLLQEGIKRKEIKKCDTEVMATEILGLVGANLYYGKSHTIDVTTLFAEIDKNFLQSLKV